MALFHTTTIFPGALKPSFFLKFGSFGVSFHGHAMWMLPVNRVMLYHTRSMRRQAGNVLLHRRERKLNLLYQQTNAHTLEAPPIEEMPPIQVHTASFSDFIKQPSTLLRTLKGKSNKLPAKRHFPFFTHKHKVVFPLVLFRTYPTTQGFYVAMALICVRTCCKCISTKTLFHFCNHCGRRGLFV